MRKTGILATLLLLVTGCGEDATTSPDLSVGPPDLGATTLTLTVAGGAPRMLAVYYSFYVTPLPESGPPTNFLIVTAVDPAFDCAHPSGAVDALSFLFRERGVGAITDSIASRRGPDFGPTLGGNVSGRLQRDDDRFGSYDVDGGAISVGAGGYVGGTLHFDDGAIVVDGPFGAPHCAALDAIVPG
ncbi:MAG TPA: hypothetical protein VGH63_18970 [Polyangia bacterium]